MKISFHGACQEVTGSCHLVETEQSKFLVDCGIFQGKIDSHQKNTDKFEFNPQKIDFLLLTHAHLDHCGRLPKLFKEGFNGKIYATKATKDLVEIILLDLIRIHHENQEKPLYTKKDIAKILKHFKPLKYSQKININGNIKIRMQDAGHILGSSIFEIWIKEKRTNKKIVFSGDLGNSPAPVIKDPQFIKEADVLFVESTYGGQLHENKKIGQKKFKEAILRTIHHKATLIIPIFALERSQEILYELNNLVENKIIPKIKIFFDSPLAIKATKIYKKHQNLFDYESKHLIKYGDDIFNFPNLKFTKTREESININTSRPPKIILAGSGMCSGGRIPHHLKRHLKNKKDQLLIISYQAEGTLGRELIEGADEVLIDNKKIKVNLKITKINSYSAHADHQQLLNWINHIENLKKIFIIHGEKDQNQKLAQDINPNIKTIIPEYHQEYLI